jgi:hypothetical protein
LAFLWPQWLFHMWLVPITEACLHSHLYLEFW